MNYNYNKIQINNKCDHSINIIINYYYTIIIIKINLDANTKPLTSTIFLNFK